MFRVNGLHGHIRRNDLRAAAMFLGFLVAFQVAAAVALLPPLILLDMRRMWLFEPLAYLVHYGPWVLGLGALLFVAQMLGHVRAMRLTLAFDEVDRWTEQRLFDIVQVQAIAAGLPPPRVGVIETGARNAFACGLHARAAVVVATRGLVDGLDDEELAAVVAHELAHVRHGDIRLMAAANVLTDNVAMLQRWNLLKPGTLRMFLMVLVTPYLFLALLSGFATWLAVTVARASRLLVSSAREYVADAEAARMTTPAALASALRAIEGRSAIPGLPVAADAMMIDGAAEGPTASHPTIAERIAVLRRLSGGWTEEAAPRLDTRRLDTRHAGAVPPPSSPWGRPPAAAEARAPLRPGVAATAFGRVRAGAAEPVFGFKRRHWRLLIIGMAGLAAMQFIAVLGHQGRLARDAANGIETGGPQIGNEPKEFADPADFAAYNHLSFLSLSRPALAGCFAAQLYGVGDHGLLDLRPPDWDRVARMVADPGLGKDEVSPESYLARHRRSRRAAADGTDRDLLAYVTTRESALEEMHRFFGWAGLRLIQDDYASPEDAAVLERLRARQGSLAASSQTKAEVAFLVSSPEHFIPCVARFLHKP